MAHDFEGVGEMSASANLLWALLTGFCAGVFWAVAQHDQSLIGSVMGHGLASAEAVMAIYFLLTATGKQLREVK